MLQRVNARPRRIMMTVDAVGGVWQYALSLAEQLVGSGDVLVLAGLGPPPTPEQRRQAERIAALEWLRTPPDWMASRPEDVAGLHDELSPLVREYRIDLVQVNEPGQAADLSLFCPVVAVAHSCTATWFHAVREASAPDDWKWRESRTWEGMKRADLVVAPSATHASALIDCYGVLPRLIVVHNSVSSADGAAERDNIVFAAGRWWDDGKNGSVLDAAASQTNWPIFAAGATTGPNGDAITFRNAVSLG
ncbi:MAG: glycosyltransferase family 4 protein, partial [Pseudomonadota bacterium]|nr:glycosyltransferase family 4 protein [Pseudomonadota bacterium]